MAVSVTPTSSNNTPAIQTPAFAGGTLTFTGLNGGTQFPANVTIAVGILADVAPGTIQIGGNTMSLIGSEAAGGGTIYLYYYDTSALVTDALTSSTAANGGVCGVEAWYLSGVATGGPTNVETFESPNFSTTLEVGLLVPSGGAYVAALAGEGMGFAPATPTWVGATSTSGDFASSLTSPSNILLAGAHGVTGGSITIGSSSPHLEGTNAALIGAAWSPAGGGAISSIAIPRKIFLKPKKPFQFR
jgi:hypothetical protein